ncbi:MAG TPA: prepilin-type N-terminal cleavage/methylation domain-containing protein [Candidatus Acidoferrales bacterium]|nr:prepilin-type N-terminal cleavage/methylation domain-containing protein [Candidatus Acidoferrales bacterium]
MSYNRKTHSRDAQEGFSLLEMLTVLAIMMILAAMAIISINGALPAQEATAGVNAAAGVFRQGRDSAVAERRSFQLVTTVPNQIGLERIEIGGTLIALPIVTLPAPAQFMMYQGIPDTPDGYGTCTNGLCFGGTPTQTWLSDGTFVDAAGNPLNATIFIAVPGKSLTDPTYMSTQRAFTILGTTGRIRAYRWTGGSWVLQ